MPAASFWNSVIWTRFASPRCDRALFQRIQRTKPQRIVELGLDDLTRSTRAISMAQRNHDGVIYYCGIDLFEGRANAPLKLKQAHHRLTKTGAKTRLVPGELASALSRTANVLSGTDLLIIDAVHDRDELEKVFHFFPRMLHPNTSIARYDLDTGIRRLRWMKPDSFVNRRQSAA